MLTTRTASSSSTSPIPIRTSSSSSHTWTRRRSRQGLPGTTPAGRRFLGPARTRSSASPTDRSPSLATPTSTSGRMPRSRTGTPIESSGGSGARPRLKSARSSTAERTGCWTSSRSSSGPEVQTQHAAQLHSDPVPETDFFILNTRRSPFNDVRVRRALNYALDRRVIAGTYGGPAAATPTCQLLPPGLPGYSRYCPYTSDPSPSGAWSGPDFARARRLIAASGTKGASITVWGFTDDPTIRPSAVRDVAGVLRRLGYRVRVHLRTHELAFRHPGRVASHQIGPAGWSAAFPSAGNFLSPWIPCNGFHNDHRFCDPRVDNEMRRATLQCPHRPARLRPALDAHRSRAHRPRGLAPAREPSNHRLRLLARSELRIPSDLGLHGRPGLAALAGREKKKRREEGEGRVPRSRSGSENDGRSI